MSMWHAQHIPMWTSHHFQIQHHVGWWLLHWAEQGEGVRSCSVSKKKNGDWVPAMCWALSLKNRGRAGHTAQTTRKLHLSLRVSAGRKSWVCQYCSSTHRWGDVGGNTHRSQIHTGQRPTYVCCPSDDVSWDITYEMLCSQRMGQKQMEKPTETFRVSFLELQQGNK